MRWIVEMAEWRSAFASDWRMLFFCSLVFFLLAVFAFGDGCGSIAYFLETLLNVLDIGLLGLKTTVTVWLSSDVSMDLIPFSKRRFDLILFSQF